MVVHFFSIWHSRRVSGKFVWVYCYFSFIFGTVLGFWVTCFGFTDYFVFFYIWFSLWFLEILVGFMVTVVVPGQIVFTMARRGWMAIGSAGVVITFVEFKFVWFFLIYYGYFVVSICFIDLPWAFPYD